MCFRRIAIARSYLNFFVEFSGESLCPGLFLVIFYFCPISLHVIGLFRVLYLLVSVLGVHMDLGVCPFLMEQIFKVITKKLLDFGGIH